MDLSVAFRCPTAPATTTGTDFPAEIISYAVWLYHRFALSLRDFEELLFERGIVVTYESIRAWVEKFGERFAAELRRRERRPGRTWHLDGVFLKIRGEQVSLWRAVDENGQVLDILVQEQRDADAAERFFRRLLAHAGGPPERIRTDRLASYAAAMRRLPELDGVEHEKVHSGARLNNRVEQSHLPTRLREYRMQRFKSKTSAQQFLSAFSRFCNHFRLRRHLLSAAEYRTRGSVTSAGPGATATKLTRVAGCSIWGASWSSTHPNQPSRVRAF